MHYRSITLRIFGPISFCFFAALSIAAGRGPFFPSHRFPIDTSFHISSGLDYFSSSSNFVGPLSTEALLDNSSLNILRGDFQIEYQASRQFSAGLNVNFDRSTLSLPSEISRIRKPGLSDHHLFAEFRAVDGPGYSFGPSLVVKFPTYSNPSLSQVNPDDPEPTIFLGDAQTDFTFLLSTEVWPSSVIRTRLDGGYTHRLENFGGEFPYQAAIAFVTPKVDLELRLKGNFNFKKVAPLQAGEVSEIDDLRSAFQNSRYALSENPWHFIVEPNVELWLSPSWAAEVTYSYSWMGDNSAKFQNFRLGVIYRWAQKKSQTRRTFKQVDITTDQDAGTFQGELQGKELEPKFRDPNPIEVPTESDEEFF